jgi:hypothetical protein
MRHLNRTTWPLQIDTAYKDGLEEWCNQNIGKKHYKWMSYRVYTTAVFAFTDSESLLMFKLACT